MRRIFIGMLALLTLAGCAADPVWAPDEAIRRVTYRQPGPPRLTLLTMVSNDTGKGAHSALMINASQRVIWDPSGSFHHDSIPERNDLLYGITPAVADVYTRYHARKTWHVVIQEVDVSPEVAELAFRLARDNGAVMNAYCTNSTSTILGKLPGFESIRTVMYPVKLQKQFAQIPGVRTRTLHEYDDDDNSKVLENWDPARFEALKAAKKAASN